MKTYRFGDHQRDVHLSLYSPIARRNFFREDCGKVLQKRPRLCCVYSRLFFLLLSVKRKILAGRVNVGHSGDPSLWLFSGVGSHRFARTCRSARSIGAIEERKRSVERRFYAGGDPFSLLSSSSTSSVFFCLVFFSRACVYARLRRTVGDRDEGWVVCRDGIAGAPLIYPFTHPYERPGSCKGAPILLANRATGRGPSFTPLFATLLGLLPIYLISLSLFLSSVSSSLFLFLLHHFSRFCLLSLSLFLYLPSSLASACSWPARRFLRSFPFRPTTSTASCPILEEIFEFGNGLVT